MGSALAFVIEVEASLGRRTGCPLLGVVEGMVTGDWQGYIRPATGHTTSRDHKFKFLGDECLLKGSDVALPDEEPDDC